MNKPSPEALPAGTVLDTWQVDGPAGYGTYGAVYRAHGVGHTEGPPVALKLARHPNDPRFAREARLLSRIRHPGVPRLLGQGTWTGGPWGAPHPYVVMPWVEGIRLYDWADQHPLTSLQALRLLAQVARALEATHAIQGLHRDVKGDNVLVSPEGRAFLMDFGCGTWRGAAPLTEGLLAPGTRLYRSPQALRFHWNHRRDAHPPYRATPADDVYALGVMAYRLCTGTYPPLATDPSIVGDDARDTQEVLKPPSHWKPLAPALESLLLRMLSETPQDRGSAGELATALENLAKTFGPKRARPSDSSVPTEAVVPPAAKPRRGRRWLRALLPLAAGLLPLVAGHWNLEEPWVSPPGTADGGTGGVADAAVEEPPLPNATPEPKPNGLKLEMPKEPLPGQRRPPCPRNQINIRGGCWAEFIQVSPPCGDSFYDWKGACYLPVMMPPRPSTSGPAQVPPP
ncbi:serine/threonine-protein kinase [Stigmatella erecta]|uniref:Serine/threonine protein kinase n=1 Tax=Stigmatella erecta TaxID=83460 RepID=A0A1I0JX40_9BACT|nr:serine/threonine-protein kinase [Stigmatella erecta]SEU15302.1 Serine/threonine protein kinase [Stigmatella erecta]